MINSTDLYLGAFLILCGFALSLLNLRRLIKEVNTSFPAVLISENVLLMCIGLAFISRATQEITPLNSDMQEFEKRISKMEFVENVSCNFISVLKSFGPLIVSLVNSFLTLVIDNYMHYKMLNDVKTEDEENTVQELHYSRSAVSVSKVYLFAKKYFSFLAIAVQWIVPILIALSMYPMEVKQQQVLIDEVRTSGDLCMAVVDVSNETCFETANAEADFNLELRKLLPPLYIEAQDIVNQNKTTEKEIDAVIKNIFQIIAEMKNDTFETMNVTSKPLRRKAKSNQKCVNICYLNNKSLTLYLFTVAIVSYFIPITMSTIILTKIHAMDVKRPGIKTYVSRELLYNILFWTPVMFDTFLSLLVCSYSMEGMRTSIFNVIANVYQAVKNFMNTKYFQDNSIKPV